MLDLMETPTRTPTTAADRRREGVSTQQIASRGGPLLSMNLSSVNLAAAIVHDLRNPLAAICGCAECSSKGTLDQVQTKRLVSNIHRAAGRMRELLADLADSSLGGVESAPRSNLRAIVAEACEASGATARDGVELQVNVPARIDIPMARNRMVRVFLNLIVNALEAMPGGGTIRISAPASERFRGDRTGRYGPRHSGRNSQSPIRTVRHGSKRGRSRPGTGIFPAGCSGPRRRIVGRACGGRAVCHFAAATQSGDRRKS